MKRELCEQVVLECEQLGQKMGMDFYETMKKAQAVVERWKPYFLAAQEVWQKANNRDEAVGFLLNLPDPDPEVFGSCGLCRISCVVFSRKPQKVCHHLLEAVPTG
jgi:hypothetical protein